MAQILFDVSIRRIHGENGNPVRILADLQSMGRNLNLLADTGFAIGAYSSFQVFADFHQHVVSTGATPYNVLATDNVILITTGAGAFTVNLLTAVGQLGHTLTFKKVDAGAGAVTIDGAGAETIDGAATYGLAAQHKYVTIISDGANWKIVANN